MNILISRTPNPRALKTAADFPFKKEGPGVSLTKETALDPFFAPFFQNISGLSEIYVLENQMTLTFEREDFISEETGRQAEDLIRKNISFHNPDFDPPSPPADAAKSGPSAEGGAADNDRKKPLSPELQRIEEILDRTVRPGLQADGGNLELVSFKDNKLEIAYQGACGGCPSAFMGTLEAIENILQHETGNKDLYVCPV